VLDSFSVEAFNDFACQLYLRRRDAGSEPTRCCRGVPVQLGGWIQSVGYIQFNRRCALSFERDCVTDFAGFLWTYDGRELVCISAPSGNPVPKPLRSPQAHFLQSSELLAKDTVRAEP
jgi:hypothetical protein